MTICFCILEHLRQPYHALHEVYRVTNGTIRIAYDHFWSIYNLIGVGHTHLMIHERFVWLPHIFFMFWRQLFRFRYLKAVCRRAGLFKPWRYTHDYRV